MRDVDLGQAAKIVWYSASGTPSSREFGSLQNAINFAFPRLSRAECERLLIVFDGPRNIEFVQAECAEASPNSWSAPDVSNDEGSQCAV